MMENRQGEPGVCKSAVTTAGSIPREWSAEDLACLQQTSKIIGINFSKFMRFAETSGEDEGILVGAHEQQSITNSREWAVEELETFQRAARTIQISLSRLFLFAETVLKPVPPFQSSSTTRQSAKAFPALEDVYPQSTVNTPQYLVSKDQDWKTVFDASFNLFSNDFVSVDDLEPSSMLHTSDFTASSDYAPADLGMQNGFFEHTHHVAIGGSTGVDHVLPSASHSIRAPRDPATPGSLDLAEWLNDPFLTMGSAAPPTTQALIENNTRESLDLFVDGLGQHINSDFEVSSGGGIEDPMVYELTGISRHEGAQSVEMPTNTIANLLLSHAQTADKIRATSGDGFIDPQFQLLQSPTVVESFPRAASTSSNNTNPNPRESSKALRRSRNLDVSSTASKTLNQALGSHGHTQGVHRSNVSKLKAGVQVTSNRKTFKSQLGILSRGPCIRCSISHKSCVIIPGSQDCVRCCNQKYTMSALPCLYFQITDITLSPAASDLIYYGNDKLFSLKYNIDNDLVTMTKFSITQGFGTTLHLTAWRFDPKATQDPAPTLMGNIGWHGYVLAELEIATQEIRRFVFRSVVPYIRAHVPKEDFISWNIFAVACRRVELQMDSHEFLSDVLCLWTAARIVHGGWYFAGPETLGVKHRVGGAVRFSDALFIDSQFSIIVARDILQPLRNKVLKRLYDLTHSNTSKNWFVLFLANFILLHNYRLLMKQQQMAFKENVFPFRFLLMPMIRAIHLGAKTLLAHFHYICKGQKPFEIDWRQQPSSEAAQRMAKLSHDEVDFMISLSQLVKEKLPEVKQIMETDEYESDHWFTGQLFVPDWKPPDTAER
ncbi:hypothetical protein F4777DRAFT_557525 [Nemania sp. FL0916]|nr:hypothetical protein F4777DRAFT_557525 [Nemania sp. FL0916]